MIIMILAGGLLGILQMQVTKNYISERIESDFGKAYNAKLEIRELDGLIPFNFQLQDVSLVDSSATDSLPGDTLASVQQINASLDIWSLFQNKISITGFSVSSPRVRLLSSESGGYTLGKSLTRKEKLQWAADDEPGWMPNIEIVAPQLTISDGEVFIEKLHGDYARINLPEPLSIRNISTNMFLEISETQLFWDIENLEADIVDVEAGNIRINGQVYNDDRFLEFNSFNLLAGSSEIRLNGEIDGVNLYREDITSQLRNARYNIDVSSNRINLEEFSGVVSDLPAIPKPIEFSVQTEGILDSLWVDEFSMGVGDSYFSINGFFRNLSNVSDLRYELKMSQVVLQKNDVEIFSGPLNENQFSLLDSLRFEGKANGTRDSLDFDINVYSPKGDLSLIGGTRLTRPFSYNGSISGKRLNLRSLFGPRVDSTSLNFDASVNGSGITMEEAVVEFNASAYNSRINDIAISSMELESSLVSGFFEQDYTYVSGNESVEGTGWIDFSREEPRLALKGYARNIDLSGYSAKEIVPQSSLNFDYNVELRGRSVDNLQGRANLDVKQSVINQDTVRSHQFYVDLDSPDQSNRTLRLTSSILDLNLEGNIVPTNMVSQYRYWRRYLENSYKQEIKLDSVVVSDSTEIQTQPMFLEGEFRVKDLSLIRNYLPQFPRIVSNTVLKFNVNADSARMLASGSLIADSLKYNSVELGRSTSQLTASFRSDRKIKEFANIDFKTDIARVNSNVVNADSINMAMTLRNDSLSLNQQIGTIGKNARMNLALRSVITDTTLKISVPEFFLGNEIYAWQNDGTPQLVYNREDDLAFNRFRFKNQNEFIELKGILSADREDSVQYILRQVSLERISDLIQGKVSFGGRMNGMLVTRSLTDRPSVQGELNINQLTIQDRIIGDAAFKSTYNQQMERFDTRLRVLTDTTKYNEYLDRNDDIGQDILISGYFVPPNPEVEQDTVYNFDVDFNEIDMWIIPLIADKVFESMEGRATGEGYITGNLEDFDFSSDFNVSNVFAKPRFLETNYFLNGHVVFNRETGVIIDSVDVTDTKGGQGKLWGTIDLNDFDPITFLDLNLSLNQLQFLNNDFGPDVPFYGSVSGTGEVKLSGANTDLFLQSTRPISVTENSELSIPLIEETELDESNRFIQFVDEFDLSRRERLKLGSEQVRGTTVNSQMLEEAIGDLTFNERFNIDLQFDAPRPINVKLIFDPVTGEVLTANGTGQLRITLQDEEVQMFGRYNISGGNYQFVSGEIISRRLSLESGGSIVWEGDPANARLDINAIYNVRPDINNLSAAAVSQDNTRENGSGQRVPIDLIIEITGTVSSVENNFYFRTSNTLDLSSNSTLQFALNEINRDEQQKFLQATSILLTGEFIPSQSYGQATTSLSRNLTSGSTVFNPLLSNQVISPLLSNQINALLDSDVSRFDIDFNLNAYNEIDLGIALRLYNDRLILRRQGQLTGGSQESSFGEKIGDLNATYRINRGLSVTAFHRQDQTISNVSRGSGTGDVTPSVDGIGLEAKVEFNTWQELKNRIKRTFNKLLGIKNKEKNEELASEDSKQAAKN
ncbi:hypothetical protein G3570_09530 [Balneolaceae bacterium YR4-1]|uniref:Translocation/assembly module TamB n=1 Tax=Halalkalibaculum roseum TaxID=2709311 RepID=A0A6M1T9J5_9BACT|nr:hypothetical protein [Halalkalibaculum roseum]